MSEAERIAQLLQEWSGPHGGGPPFDAARVQDFEPAILAAMEMSRREIAAIAQNPAPADFANTIAALEASGRALARVSTVYDVFTSSLNDAAMQAVEQKMAPVFAAFADEITQNTALFARIEAVHDVRDEVGLAGEERRLVEVLHRRFARHGAAAGANVKARLGAINQRLAGLTTTFSQNVLADEEQGVLELSGEADLAGLPPSLVAAAAAAAKARGRDGVWLITNSRSSMEPFLTYSARRDLREKGWRMWTSRGDGGGAHDNKAIISEILALRAEKATLLGFPTFAHWVCDNQMSRDPETALDLMLEVWVAAKAKFGQETEDLRAVARREAPGEAVEAWDHRYWAEKARAAKYDLDESALKPYLQLEKLREAMFWVAGELFGLAFAPVDDLPVYEASVRVFEVRRGAARVGLFYFDPYARPGKSSGAWMSEYRTQERFAGEVTPVVSNNANFVRADEGAPTLISWSDAVTLFHEFGHGLHGLTSNAAYPSLAGTNVVRDFVELPSQLLERWLPTRQVMSRFCVHFETGEAMPEALIDKVRRAHASSKGFETVEYLASAILDMKIHLEGATPIDPAAYETAALAEIGMPAGIVMRHRLPSFAHIFAGESYAAGYYDYIWADALTADAAEAFAAAPGGFFDKETARRLLEEILSVGDTIEAAEAFRRFRGRDVDSGALMRDRGFAPA